MIAKLRDVATTRQDFVSGAQPPATGQWRRHLRCWRGVDGGTGETDQQLP